MSVSLAHLFVAATQSETKFALQLMEVGKFPLYVRQLSLQPALYWCTGLQPIASQPQKPANLAQFESQSLHPADKGQSLYIVFCVPTEPSSVLGGRGSRPLRS
jgi:hypothetical protein